MLLAMLSAIDQFRPGWLGKEDHDNENLIMAPATPEPEASPSPGATDESLLVQTTIQPDAFPTGGGNGSGMGFYRIPEGVTSDWAPASNANGPVMQFIVSGYYSYTSEGEIQQILSTGTTKTIPANTEARLSPGDALVTEYSVAAHSQVIRGPVELLEWDLVGGGVPFNDARPGWESVSGDGWGTMILPDSPGTLELRTLQVKANEKIAPPDHGIRFIVSTAAAITVVVDLDTTVHITGAAKGIYTVYLVTFVPESGEIVYDG